MGLQLHLYDFDGTLFRSPDPPPGANPGKWWASAASLHPPCVPIKPGPEWWNQSVVSQARRSIADQNVWAIVCTGRPLNSALRYRIPELLRQVGLQFDDVYLKTGSDTEVFKKTVITHLLRWYPGITTVQIWEDRHLDGFISHVESLGRVGIPHLVRESSPPAQCRPALARAGAGIGQCYPWANRMVHRFPGAVIVHGTVTAPFSSPVHKYHHAWLEHRGMVYDWQTMEGGQGGPKFNKKGYPRAVFYELYKPERVKRYTAEEAAGLCMTTGHHGPWQPAVTRAGTSGLR